MDRSPPLSERDSFSDSKSAASASTTDSPYRFSEDELRVLRECNRESFYMRSLPFSSLFGLGAYYGVNAGFLKRNARYGATPKVVIGVILGYFLGKISYQGKCAEKIMQLPNSKLAEILRQKKRGRLPYEGADTPSIGGAIVPSPFGGDPQYAYSDSGPVDALQLDFDRPLQGGLDEIGRPSVDSMGSGVYDDDEPAATAPSPPTVTYEELRRRNREEYEQKRPKPYRPAAEETPIVTRPRPPPQGSPSPTAPRNIYGDVVER
ncbi:hypothetical protein J437_LFUL007363 [Ladona fulva]|uniref:OCIA domain-containing protein n=1 Tax=Ladona fulva TaxID=123851 RepID=A0A8K0K283_LADFU|nr:hypothetical protein J437_LFUL007363 [Ladona fulva]